MRILASMLQDDVCPLCHSHMRATEWNELPGGRRVVTHRECPNQCVRNRPQEYNEAVARAVAEEG